MVSPEPTRQSRQLADVVEMLLDKGVVINADIAVSVGDTELLGIRLRAAIASFETAAEYGLEFPEGTDRERVERIVEETGSRDRAIDEVRKARPPAPGAEGRHRPGQIDRRVEAEHGDGEDDESDAAGEDEAEPAVERSGEAERSDDRTAPVEVPLDDDG